MLITPNFEPVPPQEAVKRLRAIDERLTLKWMKNVGGDYWAILEAWRPDDPRWGAVRRGEVPDNMAFDCRAMLPPDCSPYEVEGFVERSFRPVTDAAKQSAEKMAKVQKFNRDVKAKHIEQFLEEQEYKTATTTKHEYEVQLGQATAHPMVHGVGEGSGKKRKRSAS